MLISLIATIFLELFVAGSSLRPAYACQCNGRTPEDYDKVSDAIFIGTVTERDRNVPLEGATHVTFNVSKSWKGIDTKLTTVHLDISQCQASLIDDQEYLVYAYRDLFEVRMPACSGSTPTEIQGTVGDDLAYLDAKYEPIGIIEGHTGRVNLLPIMGIIGSLIGISIVAFAILAKY